MKNTMIVVVGPTAAGKTNLSISLAGHYQTEIISADSRQMFKEMKIGTAVPDEHQLRKVPHHFIQNKSIHEYFSASMFEEEALSLSKKLFRKYNKVIMTGGSGLYINALCNGIDDIPDVDESVRNKLLTRMKDEGLESLRNELKTVDPEYCKNADLNNPKRILKALEVSIMTGRPYSSFLTRKKKKRDFCIIKVGVHVPREMLYQRINERVDRMIKAGLVDEARELFPHKHLNALNTVGYKELFQYFEEKISWEEAVRLIKRNTRRYARRQMTWFFNDREVRWFEPEEKKDIIQYIENMHPF